MRLQAEVEQLGMLGVVVMLFRLNTRVREVIHVHVQAHLPGSGFDHPRQFEHRKLFGELIKHAAFAGLGRIQTSQLDTSNRVPNIQESSRLAALPINCEWVSGDCLDAEAVQNRAENIIVVKAVDESFIERSLISNSAVYHALIQIRGPQSPNLAGEHHVRSEEHTSE